MGKYKGSDFEFEKHKIMGIIKFELAGSNCNSFHYRNSLLKNGMRTLMEWSALFWKGGNLSVYLRKR